MKKRKEPPLSAIAAKRLREQKQEQEQEQEELSEVLDEDSPFSEASEGKLPLDRQQISQEPNLTSIPGSPQEVEDGLVFTLRLHEKIAILGQARLQVQLGTLKVDGLTYSAGPNIHTLAFPTCYSAPELHALPPEVNGVDGDLDKKTVFTLSNCSNGWNKADPLFHRYTSVWNVQGPRTFEVILEGSAHPVCRIHSSWTKLISDFTANVYENPIIFVAGPKASGKSTFSRQLLHAYAGGEEVEYLEADCGQPQFTPSGIVSLCRPAPTHHFRFDCNERMRGHHIGHVTAKINPHHYISCIDDLFSHCETVTCLVNLPGWIKGMGLEILQDIVRLGLKLPSRTFHMVFLGSTDDASDIVQCMPEQVRMHYIHEYRPSKTNTRYHATDLRALRMMSYLHYSIAERDWNFLPMCELPPKAVGYASSSRDLEGVRIMEDVSAELALAAIIGTVAALIVTKQPMPCTECNGMGVISRPFDPAVSHCLGLALIRGVDTRTQTLYLTMPVQTEKIRDLQREGCLLYLERGSMDLPLVEMLPRAKDWERLPYLSMEAAEGVGAQRWHSRRNIQRRGQQ